MNPYVIEKNIDINVILSVRKGIFRGKQTQGE